MIITESILKYLRNAALYNKHELAAPTVILWPDEERLWSQCMESLRESCPVLWTLGEYSPGNATGPAVWLRYQLETYSGAEVPVLYLPGVGRAAFRNADQMPIEATHLFALQFQGQFWTQKNGKDWTPFAFLSCADGGIGLDVSADQDTKKAIQECLPALLKVEEDSLRGGKLEAADFRAIITKDPVRTLLQWMNNPIKIRQELEQSGSEWASFCAVCRDTYQIDPENDGVITATEKLTGSSSAWCLAWERFKEAPRSYQGVKYLLESLPPASLFEPPTEYKPLSNRKEEERLEADLLSLSSATPKDALVKIKALAAEHAHRTKWVWTSLGESPLAQAIVHLKELAEIVESSGNPSTWEALADYYCSTGWRVDRCVLRAVDVARSAAVTKAVATAIRAAYLPWLEKYSTLAQALAPTYPVSGPHSCRTLPVEEGTVYLFADGLRVDLARGLEEKLVAAGFSVVFEHSWSTLPTVTATAKPAWMPLAGKLGGPLEGSGFQSKELGSGKTLNHARFKQLVTECGISFLESNELGLTTGCTWTEFGSFDTYGHEQGAKLAWRVGEELKGLEDRIHELLQAGWTSVKVMTDHGWLMLPGGLPKVELPKHLTASRWSRCAIPAAGAQHAFPMTSWFWDAAEAVVLAPGVSCFVAGMEYAHGGLTLQEAIIPSLTVSASFITSAKTIVLKEIKWVGMRLNVVLEGAQGLTIDVRSKVADASSSFAVSKITGAADGLKNSLLVDADDAIGTAAFLVVLNSNDQAIFKHPVVIGEN